MNRDSRHVAPRAGRIGRLLTALLALVLSLGFIGTGPASATCAAPPALEEAITGAASVLVGEVTAAAFDSEQATLAVQWIWKGPDLGAELTVSTPLTDSAGEAGFRFRTGSTYIVIIERLSGPITVGECSGTRVFSQDGELVPSELQDAVGAAAGRPPGGVVQQEDVDPRSGDRTRAVWIGVIAAVGMILVVIMQQQSHRAGEDRRSRLRGVFSRGRSGDQLVDQLRDKD